MHTVHRPDRATRPQRSTGSTGRHRKRAPGADVTHRQQWIGACATRLASLRPGVEMETLLTLAADLWNDLGGHDPEIAAEMEQESRRDE